MNEALAGTSIEYHECPGCDAALEHNVILEWETTEPRHPSRYAPLVKCALCGYAAGAAYGYETAVDLLGSVGIDIDGATPGKRIEPNIYDEEETNQ